MHQCFIVHWKFGSGLENTPCCKQQPKTLIFSILNKFNSSFNCIISSPCQDKRLQNALSSDLEIQLSLFYTLEANLSIAMFPEVFLNPRNSKVVSYKHLPFKKVCIIRFTIQTIYNTDVFFELNRNYYSKVKQIKYVNNS